MFGKRSEGIEMLSTVLIALSLMFTALMFIASSALSHADIGGLFYLVIAVVVVVVVLGLIRASNR